METAQAYSEYYTSETSHADTLVDGFSDRISASNSTSIDLCSADEKKDDATIIDKKNSFKTPEITVAPPIKPLKGNFKLLQLWEGYVVDINEIKHEFSVVAKDKTDTSMPDEEFTMSIEEVPPTDLDLLSIGAVFYWSIGYADYPGRPRSRESRVRFRRLPKWKQADLNNAKKRGNELADFFASYQ